MKVLYYDQLSPEWWADKVGSIGGKRFGQVISTRENRLVYELINETLNGYVQQDDFMSDDMQFGVDNEDAAREMYIEKTGINFTKVGMIKSDYSDMHHASPDGLSECKTKVLEVKSTENGAIHLQRYFEGVESAYIPQIINYFAVSDEIKEVHFVSYCPYRTERPIVAHIFTLGTVINVSKTKSVTIADIVNQGREQIVMIEKEVKEKIEQFTF